MVKQLGYIILQERRAALQQTKDTEGNKKMVGHSSHLQHQQLTKPHLDTPGMAVAMAYGFVAYENTVEYKMEKWYEVEKAHKIQKTDIEQVPDQDVGECSKTKVDHVTSHKPDERKANTLEHDHQQPTGLPRRNSKRKTSIRLQLDNIPEVNED